MQRFLSLTAAVLLTFSATSQSQNRKLVWSDEFNYSGQPDSSKWAYDIGNNNGWGNNELQYYTSNEKNVLVKNGKLFIHARQEEKSGYRYTSTKLITKGKATWQYGKIEVRAKLPSGTGSWPAIWMLAENMKQWPDDGEIDIMEYVGYDPGWVHGSIHCKQYNHVIGTQKTAKTLLADAASAFHVYGLDWTKDSIKISVDNKIYFSFANEHADYNSWPFDNKMYLILNIAVGGNWGGQKGVDDKIFPATMEVDYVRVYQ
ncbi:glycoside hydrolase family 16 protein [Niabella ginsengisoli]|uniref:Glycoside hydrolase family 16 protein n=1 Tax=Niabella ginsengisoli TaxID=522298 RepID=A0ABS9SMZ4_9BACT|nr:glycoside hydrolase family 16 protein [Niabella ginsengisoli]MCH5599735.1 glycoside hydrolase family 16 protein [Niabella ginsengisoli]